MSEAITYLRELRLAGFNYEPQRGGTPTIEFTYRADSRRGIYLGMAAGFFTFILTIVVLLLLPNKGTGSALMRGLNNGLLIWFLVALGYYVSPIFRTCFLVIKHKQIPSRQVLEPYSTAQRIGSCILLSFVGLYILNHGIGILLGSVAISG